MCEPILKGDTKTLQQNVQVFFFQLVLDHNLLSLFLDD